MKVLVTGGAGFVGSNLCAALTRQPEVQQVRVIDDFSTGFVSNLEGLPVELVEGSIVDPDVLARAADSADAIVHLAALGSVPRSVADPFGSHEANATGTLNVLQAARRSNNAHVVLASSSSVYGANPTLPKAETLACAPMSPYAVSKLATEQYAMAFHHCYELPVLPFRFFNIYGPRQRAGHAYAAVIPAFLDAALRGDTLTVHGSGEQSRDFTYVGTVAELITSALLQRTTSPPCNLAFGTRTSLLDIVKLIETTLGHSIDVEHVEERPGDVKHSQADNSRLRALFGEVAPTPLPTGLSNTAEWMREFRAL
ncbi:NAD-dependent epimerase/dehydratase family protein [Aeromicrobium sp. CF4.19]|uniref:NAD-dependent epimerase/dehydratase family protein n=1 Tax=Aeromicrobium sp. CF4.19 TaxID=3373082 RepID=UPI003EE44447